MEWVASFFPDEVLREGGELLLNMWVGLGRPSSFCMKAQIWRPLGTRKAMLTQDRVAVYLEGLILGRRLACENRCSHGKWKVALKSGLHSVGEVDGWPASSCWKACLHSQ